MSVTNNEVSGYKFGQNIYLPQSIGRLAKILPPKTGMTVGYFLKKTTIFPFLKPFIPTERNKRITEILRKNESESAYKLSGFSRVETLKPRYLRYCPQCVKDDTENCGEAYWHRVHQLPGVLFCPIHHVPVLDSDMLLTFAGRRFYPASSLGERLGGVMPKYSANATKMLIRLAQDAAWVLKNGYTLHSSEETLRKYHTLLGQKGLLIQSRAKVMTNRLNEAITEFFGGELLDILEIPSYESMPWSSKLLHGKSKLANPVWHLLMIKFLASSAKKFFNQPHLEISPYGIGPWPCRNPVCDYNMQNVISNIDVVYESPRYKATFSCPYCGYTYRRSNGGHVDEAQNHLLRFSIIDYGWKWEELMTEHLKNGVLVMKIMELMHCGYRTVMEFGAANGFFTSDRVPRRYFYDRRVDKPDNYQSPADLQLQHRKKWKDLASNNPDMSRSGLMRRLPMAHKWLIENDIEWYEDNSPKSRRNVATDWQLKDVKWLDKVKTAIESLLQTQERPVWVSMRAIERLTGINNFSKPLKDGKIPLTKAYLDEHIENRDDWNWRRIRWAVEKLNHDGALSGLFAVRIASGLSPKMFEPLKEYANDYVKHITDSKDN